MKPVDLRNETWADIQGRICEEMMRVYLAYGAFGPATTRAIAEKMRDIGLLTVRPRTSDLVDLGLVELVTKQGHEGVYAAVPMDEARRRHESRREEQPELRFSPNQ